MPDSNAEGAGAVDFASDAEIVATVLDAFNRANPASRLRLLRTVATFLGLDVGGTAATPSLPSQVTMSVPSFSEQRTVPPKQFMLDKRPQTDVERVACLAYYLAHFRDQGHFKTLDLSKLNTEAAQIKFSNAAKAVDNAVQAGFLVPVGKGNKQISAIGELYVQALPDRAAAKDAIAHARRRRKPRRTGVNSDVAESTSGAGEAEE